MQQTTYIKNVSTLTFDVEKCNGCGVCLNVCPHAVFERSNKRVRVVDRDNCMECGACKINCAQGAIGVKAGVGCASAIINSVIPGKNGDCCDC